MDIVRNCHCVRMREHNLSFALQARAASLMFDTDIHVPSMVADEGKPASMRAALVTAGQIARHDCSAVDYEGNLADTTAPGWETDSDDPSRSMYAVLEGHAGYSNNEECSSACRSRTHLQT